MHQQNLEVAVDILVVRNLQKIVIAYNFLLLCNMQI
jgi:hypothetical protein